MKIFILTGTRKLSEALQKFVGYVFPEFQPEFSFGSFNYESINPIEWKEAEVLITEAMNPDEPNNPVGWRTAKRVRKKHWFFLLFPGKTLNRMNFSLPPPFPN